jgi:hypothetical protein
MKPLTTSLTLIAALCGTALAQQPRISNARLETRAVTNLERDFRALVASRADAMWIGYTVPIVPGERQMCCWSSQDGNCCRLETPAQGVNIGTREGVKLEGPTHMLVLFRSENREVGKIRTFSDDCAIDAGGLPVYLLTGVRPEDSVALLSPFVTAPEATEREGKRRSDAALTAIAMHGTPAADQALERLVASGQPESLRGRVTFWLGNARGRRGYEVLRKLAQDDPSDSVRDKVTFALTQSKEAGAIDTLIAMARSDRSIRVRGQALFWLANKAGAKAAAAITDAIENDPETEVKKKAVFALSQLPKDDGVPKLIQVARTNRNPAVRKQAIFWLGQSKDPRALSFFEEVLR